MWIPAETVIDSSFVLVALLVQYSVQVVVRPQNKIKNCVMLLIVEHYALDQFLLVSYTIRNIVAVFTVAARLPAERRVRPCKSHACDFFNNIHGD